MFKSILTAVLLTSLPLLSSAAGLEETVSSAHQAVAGAAEHAADTAHAEHHGLPSAAPQFHLGPLVFTNSMLVTWIVALGLILFAQVATREVKLVPDGMQNFCEWLVESLYNFLGSVLGPQLIKKSFWFFATLFIFILFTNWFGLIPGVGTIGQNVTMSDGSHVFKPFLRGGNADLNMTLAMSLTFFFLWTFWSFQSLGVAGFFKHIFSGGGGSKGFMAIAMMGIFFFVGVIEVISIAFRPVSLSFRIYGNIFAGENILEAMLTLVPWLGWLLPLPFYFLELLVGLVQALVFTLLTSVFTSLMCAHHEHAHEEAPGHGHAQAKH
jgi:F-type H+-transporting ATPase subunit a